MGIKITRYTPFSGDGPVMGVCSFTLDSLGMYFNDVPVIKKKAGGFFVGAPSRKYEDADGQTKYASYWGFEDRERSRKFQGAMIKALKEFWQQQKTAPPPPPPQPQQAQAQSYGSPGAPTSMSEYQDEGLPF